MRKNIADILNRVAYDEQVYGVGRHDRIEAIIMKYPSQTSTEMSDIANYNANSKSFAFLANEPDLYSIDDLKKRYV